ncbi:MAG: sigma 54-interacting transcriptional regulator [Myxococcaceae bacterium]
MKPTVTAALAADALNAEEQQAFDPAKLDWLLEVLSGPQAGATREVPERLMIGNAPDADLMLDDATVSRRHAQLESSPQGLWVKDLGSKNGTFLHGTRVEGFVVRREASFTVGTTLLRVSAVPKAQRPEITSFGEALGSAPAMRTLFATLRRAAPTAANVLLLGETGTGKELLARGVHEHSPRRHRPFVVVDCGALAPTLTESELFGHVKGAFTGAQSDRAGAFAAAQGGTLFLDEVGELSLELQPKLLRALEARSVRRLGEDAPRQVDVRVVAATHRDLEKEVAAGRFREDLYFRLAVVVAKVPALRERRDDLPMLAQSILLRMKRPDFELSSAVRALFEAHPWPGNVRELRNVIERAVLGDAVGAPTAPGGGASKPFKEQKDELIEVFTRDYFTRLYQECGGSVAELARRAGIARTYAHEVLKKYGLK